MAAGARSSYLRRLAALAIGEAPVLVPRLPNRFSGTSDDEWREQFDEAPSLPATPRPTSWVEPAAPVREPLPHREDRPVPPGGAAAAEPPVPSGDVPPLRRAGADRPAVQAVSAEPARPSTATANPPGAEVRIVHRDEPAAAPRPGPDRATAPAAPAATARAAAPSPTTSATPTSRRPPAERPYIGPAVEVAARRRPPDPTPITVRIGRVEVTVARPTPAPAPASLPERIAEGDDSPSVPDLSTYLRDPYARGQGTQR